MATKMHMPTPTAMPPLREDLSEKGMATITMMMFASVNEILPFKSTRYFTGLYPSALSLAM